MLHTLKTHLFRSTIIAGLALSASASIAYAESNIGGYTFFGSKLAKSSSLYGYSSASKVASNAAPKQAIENVGGYVYPGGFSLTLTGVTEYVYRGLSFSNEQVAAQGSLDYTHPSGFYAGVWGSNFDTGEFMSPGDSEVRFYSGWIFDIGAGVDLDVGATYHLYPGVSDNRESYDFYEYNVAFEKDWKILKTRLGLNYSPNYFGDSGNAFYTSVDVTVPIYDTLHAETHYGYQTIEDDEDFGFPNYGEWFLGLGYELYKFNLSARYHDTDLDNTTCRGRCEGRVVYGVSRQFKL